MILLRGKEGYREHQTNARESIISELINLEKRDRHLSTLPMKCLASEW